jgi:hypothetical protein
MAKTTMVVIAAVQITGGTKLDRCVVAAGEELTTATMKALGITDKDLPGMIARGQVEEVTARAAEAPADGQA